MVRSYRPPTTPWTPSSAANTYGTSGAWVAAIDTRHDAAQAAMRDTGSTTRHLQEAAMGTIPAESTRIASEKVTHSHRGSPNGANVATASRRSVKSARTPPESTPRLPTSKVIRSPPIRR